MDVRGKLIALAGIILSAFIIYLIVKYRNYNLSNPVLFENINQTKDITTTNKNEKYKATVSLKNAEKSLEEAQRNNYSVQDIEDAKEADKSLSTNQNLGPLHGVPMTIKESYNIKGQSTNWGIPEYKGNIAKEDGLAVQRFKNAGAHFLGKTNVPMNLADFQSYNDIYGTTGNPWDVNRTPGGSSGGSAAALAAGFTSLEAGSDIGGSIRNPAHYCGVFGHKPSHGIIPSSGHELIPNVPEPDLSVCGPLARSAKDLEIALDIMAGPIEREARGWQLNLPESRKSSLKDFNIAIWSNDEMAPVSKDISQRCEEVGKNLASVGANVSYTAKPDHDFLKGEINYQLLLQSVMQSGMSDDEFKKIEEIASNLDKNDLSA